MDPGYFHVTGAHYLFFSWYVLMIGLIHFFFNKLYLRQIISLNKLRDLSRVAMFRCGIWCEKSFTWAFIYRFMKCTEPLELFGCGRYPRGFCGPGEAAHGAQFIVLNCLFNSYWTLCVRQPKVSQAMIRFPEGGDHYLQMISGTDCLFLLLYANRKSPGSSISITLPFKNLF